MTLDEHLRRALADVGRGLVDEAKHLTPVSSIQTRKLTAFVPVSCCALTDSTNENHCQHPPTSMVRPSWRQRARWRWAALRIRVGSRIAGVELEGDDR